MFICADTNIFQILAQVLEPWIQERKLVAYVEHKHVIPGILKHVKRGVIGRLLAQDGKPNMPVLEKLECALLSMAANHFVISYIR